MPNEEVKTEAGTTETPSGNGESGERKGGVNLVHKVYENKDDNKSMDVYVCCNIQ